MDQRIPVTGYDFKASLSAGFLLIFAVDRAAGTQISTRDSWNVVQSVIAVSLAYVVGLTPGPLACVCR